jgi:putative phage-type endonuclease
MSTESLQRTPEWYKKRLGKVTASKIDCLVKRQKDGKFYASREEYKNQLILEILTGEQLTGFTSAAMQHGIDTEDEAFDSYARTVWATVSKADFVVHPTIDRAGASPDGYVGDDGLIEIKCPNSYNHLDTLRRGTFDKKYHSQMQWQMACTGRKWVDFVSYDPRVPEAYRLFVDRVERDDLWIAQANEMVEAFLKEVDEEITRLHHKFEEKDEG